MYQSQLVYHYCVYPNAYRVVHNNIHSITGTLSLENVSVPVVHPKHCILHTKPGVWIGPGMELVTAQAALPQSTANGTASSAHSLKHRDFESYKLIIANIIANYTVQIALP